MKTVHITDRYQPYQVRNEKTFKKSHTNYLKKRKVLLINGIHTDIEVVSVINQQFEKIGEEYIFTADIQYKELYNEEE